MNPTCTCVIPAKGSSERSLCKNLQLCAGWPLVEWAISIALRSEVCFPVLVSTESEEIMRIAGKFGWDIPYRRPAAMASPASFVGDAVADILKWSKTIYGKTDYVLLLHPTSPCIEPLSVAAALSLLNGARDYCDMCVSVSPADVPLNKIWPEGRSLKGFLTPEEAHSRSQDTPGAVKLNNGITVGKWDIFENNEFWYDREIIPYVLDKTGAIDIDTREDLILAEAYLEWRKRHAQRN